MPEKVTEMRGHASRIVGSQHVKSVLATSTDMTEQERHSERELYLTQFKQSPRGGFVTWWDDAGRNWSTIGCTLLEPTAEEILGCKGVNRDLPVNPLEASLAQLHPQLFATVVPSGAHPDHAFLGLRDSHP